MGLAEVVEKGESSGRQKGEQNDYFKLKVILYSKQILNHLAK